MAEPFKNIESVAKDLRAILKGEVLADELSRAAYSSAACIYRLLPLVIVQPRHREDVIECVRYAGAKGIPLTARGAGTGRAGQGIGEGILLDFVRHMNQILKIDPQRKLVRVQPGLILGTLNTALKSFGRFFPIDPSTGDYCTLGGMVANNSSGPHAVKYGATRDYVDSLEVVLANGEIINTGPRSEKEISSRPATTLEGKIYQGIAAILNRYQEPLQNERPQTTKNSCGYDLWQVRKNELLDLTPLLVGSEGTLGIFTEASLRLVDLPGRTHSALVYFSSLETVGKATEEILKFSPTMLEIMEKQIIDLARAKYPEMRPYLPEGIEATLFIEFEGESDRELRDRMNQVASRLVEEQKLALSLREAQDSREREMLTKVRSVSGPILNKVKGPKKPIAFIEDAAVHPSRLGEYIAGLRQIFKSHQAEASIYGHAGDGNLHIMVFLDLKKAEDIVKMARIAEETYELVLRLKGTISGEHGDGLLRTAFVPQQYPKLYPAFAELKNLFDPQKILNPGRIVGDDPDLLSKNLKYGREYKPQPTGSHFDKEVLRTEAESCHGCGKCRSYCPVALETQEESFLGRAKAVLLREVIAGRLKPELFLASKELKAVMDTCLNCKRCLTECPTGVDIPWLAQQARTHYVKEKGQPFKERLITNTRFICRLGSALAPLADLSFSWPPVRSLMESALDLDRRRKLPSFARQTFRRHLPSQPSSNGKAVYFLSCFANYNDPQGEALAAWEILTRHGFEVELPDFECCGLARISAGALEAAAEGVEKNFKKIVSFREKGIPVIFSEPSCALAVKLEYPRIVEAEEAAKAVTNCYEIHQFLFTLKEKGKLNLNFGEIPRKIGYHNPCHLRALGVTREPVELLKLIPGLEVKVFQDRCCGLAGTFGLKKKNHDLSLEIGAHLFTEIKNSGVDLVATSCGSCALQIFQGTGLKAVHPLTLLAEAYREKI